jgi:hypothetical protein
MKKPSSFPARIPFLIRLILAGMLASIAVPAAFAQDRGLIPMAREAAGKADFDVGRQYAVIIGIDRYKEWPSLRSAASEAKAVRKVLAERYYIDEFFELYDEDATAANIRRLFVESLPKKILAPDSLLIFYAGHGHLDASKTGFWIASDATTDAFDQRGWVGNAQLRNMIGGLKAQRILVLADACFSGDFLNVSRGAVPVIDSAYYRKALQLTARQVLTSGASTAVPDESEFGRQLLNLLERNEEPLLDPVAMYERIRRGVTKTLPLLGTLPGNEEGASFVLFRRSAGAIGAGAVSGAVSGAASGAAASFVPSGTGELMVRTSEPGAEIFVDGLSFGKAPILIKKLEAGRLLRVQARTATMSGSTELRLEPGEIREVALSMTALTGNILVTANEGAVNLWVDGVDKGPLGSGLFKALPVGLRKIELRGQDLYGEAQASVVPGETMEVKALVRPVGSLVIDAPEGTPIRIVGSDWTIERVGGGRVERIPAGSLAISSGGAGFVEAKANVSLAKGQNFSWKPYAGAFLEFAVSPPSSLFFLDGAPGGEAAGSIAGVAPGKRSVLLRKPGYRDTTVSISLSVGKSFRVEAKLVKLAPARVSFPSFGIELGFAPTADVAAQTAAKGAASGLSVYSVAAGLPQNIGFASPYAMSLDLPAVEASFAEGEERRLDLPSGRISLPYLPAGAKVGIGGGKSLDLANEAGIGFSSPPLPPGEYRVKVGGYFSGTVRVAAGGYGEPNGYREAVSAKLSAERSGYRKSIAAKKGKTGAGWISLATGILGAAGAGTVYYLGTEAMDAYRAIQDSESTAELWKSVETYQVLLPVSAAIGALGLGLSPFLLTGGPDPKELQRSIDAVDEGIRALGK